MTTVIFPYSFQKRVIFEVYQGWMCVQADYFLCIPYWIEFSPHDNSIVALWLRRWYKCINHLKCDFHTSFVGVPGVEDQWEFHNSIITKQPRWVTSLMGPPWLLMFFSEQLVLARNKNTVLQHCLKHSLSQEQSVFQILIVNI